MKMNLLTHNGFITVKSVKTSEHRTFRVRTEKWCDGKRVVSLLQGSDNTSDYVGFGFIREYYGKLLIDVWKSRGEAYRKLATLLEKLDEHTAAGNVEVNFEGTCRVCNRTLTVPESVSSGIGPVCAGRKAK
jgi:hypothetical protein